MIHLNRPQRFLLRCSALLTLASLAMQFDDSTAEARIGPPDSATTLQTGKSSGITALAFNPSGSLLAAGGYRVVRLFDPVSGKEIAALRGPTGVVTSLRFSADGHRLAAGSGEPGKSGQALIWNIDSVAARRLPAMAAPQVLSGPSDVVYSIAISPDGKTLAAASYDHSVTLWDLAQPSAKSKTRNPAPKLLSDHTDSVYSVAFSPDSRLLASCAGDRTVKVWDVRSGKRLYTLSESTAELYSVAFRPDGKQIAAGGADKQLRIWSVAPAGATLAKSVFAHSGSILRVEYTSDGRDLVTSGDDLAVKRWDSTTLQEKRVYAKQPDWPQGIAISSSGKTLAVGCHNGALAIYDTGTGTLIRRLLAGSAPLVNAKPDTPRTSSIPGRRLGDNKQRGPVSNGGLTLFAASLGDISPRGAPRGGTVRFTLFGGLINDASAALFDDPAITAKLVGPPDSNTGILRLDVNLGKETRLGIHRVFVQTPHGSTSSVPFAVGAWPEVGQSEPNDTAAAAQRIPIPCTVVGALDAPGDVDCYRFEAKAGQEIVFEVVAQQLRSRLQPVLTLLDPDGVQVAASRTRFGRPDALLGYRIQRDGAYVVQLRDFEGAGGGDVHYRLNVGELPVITDIYPLGAQAGSETSFGTDGFNLGGVRTTTLRIPPDASGSTLEVSPGAAKAPLYSSRPARIGPDPEIVQIADNTSLNRAAKVTAPIAINGRLESTGKGQPLASNPVNHFYRFHANRGESLTIDVLARRAGSSLDSEIEVLNDRGEPVERAVARPIYNTEITLNDRDSATNALRIFAWDGVGINDYLMVGREIVKVVEMPRGPDSDIFFRTFRGQRLTYFGTTPEFHSVAQAVYKVEVYPPGTRFSPNGYPVARLTYRNDDGGPLFGKDSHLGFVAPADGDYVVRIGDSRGQSGHDYPYRLTIHPPRPDFKLLFTTENINVPLGGGSVVSVECERYDGFDEAIDLSLEGLPAGLTATSTTIERGETSASILVSALPGGASAPLGDGPLRIVGKARVGGNEVKRSADLDHGLRRVTILPVPDVKVSTALRELAIHPGEEITIDVAVERQGKFGGRIPLEVRNLPFGVQVQNIGLNGILVTEEESARSISIRCEPWVSPQTRPFYIVAALEGGVANSAPPLLIHVLPAPGKSAEKPKLKVSTSRTSRRGE